jgi:hypothetical protein
MSMKIVLQAHHHRYGKNEIDRIFAPSQGDWPENLWDQLAINASKAYRGDELDWIVIRENAPMWQAKIKVYKGSEIAELQRRFRENVRVK